MKRFIVSGVQYITSDLNLYPYVANSCLCHGLVYRNSGGRWEQNLFHGHLLRPMSKYDMKYHLYRSPCYFWLCSSRRYDLSVLRHHRPTACSHALISVDPTRPLSHTKIRYSLNTYDPPRYIEFTSCNYVSRLSLTLYRCGSVHVCSKR